jgi:hypothetical protein
MLRCKASDISGSEAYKTYAAATGDEDNAADGHFPEAAQCYSMAESIPSLISSITASSYTFCPLESLI